jgi:ribosomal protein S18 acetylase RimI-like enzyme
VRRAGPADLDAIDAIEGLAFTTDRFSRRSLARLLKAETALSLIAEREGRAEGYALLLFRRGSTVARLYSVAVTPEARGAGVASALMQAAEVCAIDSGCDRLRLEVRARNAPAIRLYERNGFALLKRLPGYYRDGAEALQMQKRLNDAKSRHP